MRTVFSKKGNRPYQQTGEDKWTQFDDDLLLDHYLLGQGLKELSDLLKRSISSIDRRLTRLSAGQRSCANYQPKMRIKRPEQFTKRDVELMRKCLGSKDKDLKLLKEEHIRHLSLILNRSTESIQKYLSPRDKSEGFFK